MTICHVGNNPTLIVNLCREFGVSNISFLGSLERPKINQILNESRFGLMTSNLDDGCPRVITEIMCSGTPLLVRKQTRLLEYYRKFGVVVFDDSEVEKKFEQAFKIYDFLKTETNINMHDLLTMKTICEKNLELWLHKN